MLGDFGLQTASIFNQDNINDLFLINCNGFMILLTSITMFIHLYIDILVVMIYYMLPYKTGPASLPLRRKGRATLDLEGPGGPLNRVNRHKLNTG